MTIARVEIIGRPMRPLIALLPVVASDRPLSSRPHGRRADCPSGGDQDVAALECFFRPLRADGRGRLKGPPYDCRQARRGGSLKGRPTMRGSPKGAPTMRGSPKKGALRCAEAETPRAIEAFGDG